MLYFSSGASELARRPISVSSSSITSISSMEEDSRSNVVDLTAESDSEALVVDLTSPVQRQSRARKARGGQQSDHDDDAILISGAEDEDDDVIIVPSTAPHPPLPSSTTPSTPLHSTTPLSSPGPRDITCPICMDSKRTFTEAGRSLVTTNCGHIFCDGCIRQSIQLMHKCPTCAKKLTLKQYHKIYI